MIAGMNEVVLAEMEALCVVVIITCSTVVESDAEMSVIEVLSVDKGDATDDDC